MKKILLASAVLATVAACAKQPDQIKAAPASSLAYEGASCSRLASERATLETQVAALSASQRQKATNDAVAMGVGLVLFAPAVLFIGASGDDEAQLANAKGELDAVYKAQLRRNCRA